MFEPSILMQGVLLFLCVTEQSLEPDMACWYYPHLGLHSCFQTECEANFRQRNCLLSQSKDMNVKGKTMRDWRETKRTGIHECAEISQGRAVQSEIYI